MITVHCAYFVVTVLNTVPDACGILEKYSLRKIVISWKLDTKKDCQTRFGAYVEASKDANITNTLAKRTHSCLALGPSVNCRVLLSVLIFSLVKWSCVG